MVFFREREGCGRERKYLMIASEIAGGGGEGVCVVERERESGVTRKKRV